MITKAQKKAIEHINGAMLVVSGPGSGKTTVIVNRLIHLEKMGIKQNEMLVITFTRLAFLEMKERHEKLINRKSFVEFATFHSLFFKILKIAYKNVKLINEFEKRNLIIKFVKEKLPKDIDVDFDEYIDNILSYFSYVNSKVSVDEVDIINLLNIEMSNTLCDVMVKVKQQYDEFLESENLIDFDGILTKTYDLLKNREDIRKKLSSIYKYILIDEFQDINEIQYEIIKLIAIHENLFVVGDDDQAIYTFRGSNPNFMINFDKTFKNVEKVYLDINFRCKKNIVDISKHLIESNKNRIYKELKSNCDLDANFSIKKFEDIYKQRDYVVKSIDELIKKGEKLEEIAIISRTNSEQNLIIQMLMDKNIEFLSKNKIKSIFSHTIIKDYMTYFDIANGNNSRKNFLRIYNKPLRYIKKTAFVDDKITLNKLQNFYYENDRMLDVVYDFFYELDNLKNLKPIAAIKYINNVIGYRDYLEENFDEDELKEIDKNIEEFEEFIKDINNFEELKILKEKYEKELEKSLKVDEDKTDKVLITTMHSSKGLEFNNVFIINTNENNIPYKSSKISKLSEDIIEEERRLFYVALTRAKKNLVVCCIENKKIDVSMFIDELKKTKS